MTKKEFERKYIKDKRTEDEKMLEIIHKNARKVINDKTIKKNTNERKNVVYALLMMCLTIIVIIVGAICIK